MSPLPSGLSPFAWPPGSMTADLVVEAHGMAAWTRRHFSLEGLFWLTDGESQCISIAYPERLCIIGADPSTGTVGDSCDSAEAESVLEICKTEPHRNPAALAANGGSWRGLDDLEIATCTWTSWFNEEVLPPEPDDQGSWTWPLGRRIGGSRRGVVYCVQGALGVVARVVAAPEAKTRRSI
jgi:hypothetical protein